MGIGFRDPACRENKGSPRESCSLATSRSRHETCCDGPQTVALEIVRPRPSPPNSRAIPSLRWVNALKMVERTSGSIQCRCLKSRPKSGSFRFERLHGFAAFLGEFGGVFQQIPEAGSVFGKQHCDWNRLRLPLLALCSKPPRPVAKT